MIRSTSSTTTPSGAAERKRPALAPLVILVLIGIVVIATGAAYVSGASGPTHYACMNISRQGNEVTVTTTGLLHYLNAGYYVSCSEGSSLPISKYQNSCLTISPKTVSPSIGLGASTEYYYISSTGNLISLKGASTPVNATEFTSPAGLSLTVAC